MGPRLGNEHVILSDVLLNLTFPFFYLFVVVLHGSDIDVVLHSQD